MYRHALIAMKAYPFHKGHEFLISEAQRRSDKVTVLVVWGPNQSPTGEQRQSWVQKTFPDVDVRLISDLCTDQLDASGDPEQLEKSSKMWAVYALDVLKGEKPDVVFSSEAYGQRWAQYMGAEFVNVDVNRTRFPVSGTMIRNDPYLFWQYMNRYARQHYLKRVLIVGPESTGKTTMCQNLALKYGTVYSPEYGRIYDEQTRAPKAEFEDERWRTIYTGIVNEQPVLNAEAEAEARHVCFYDTDLLTTAMWYREWQPEFGYDGLYQSIIEAAKKQPPFDLVIIMPLAEWVDDGYRGQTEEVRVKFYNQLLKDHNDRPHKVLEGKTWEEKQAEAIKLVNSLFSGSDMIMPAPRVRVIPLGL